MTAIRRPSKIYFSCDFQRPFYACLCPACGSLCDDNFLASQQTRSEWTDTSRTTPSQSPYRLCPHCQSVIYNTDFKNSSELISVNSPKTKDAGLIELCTFLKSIPQGSYEELRCRLEIWGKINAHLITNDYDLENYPEAVHHDNIKRLIVLFKEYPDTYLFQQAEVHRQDGNFQESKFLLNRLTSNGTAIDKKWRFYNAQKSIFIYDLCEMKDCLVREIGVYPDEGFFHKAKMKYERHQKEFNNLIEKWKGDRLAVEKKENNFTGCIIPVILAVLGFCVSYWFFLVMIIFVSFLSSFEEKTKRKILDKWDLEHPEPVIEHSIEPLFYPFPKITCSLWKNIDIDFSSKKLPLSPDIDFQYGLNYGDHLKSTKSEKKEYYIVWNNDVFNFKKRTYPIVFEDSVILTERVPFKYSNEQIAIGILHEYWKSESRLEASKKDLLEEYEIIVKNKFVDTIENSIISLSNIARNEYGEECALNALISGKEIAPNYEAITINYLVNTASFFYNRLSLESALNGGVPFESVEQEVLSRVSKDLIKIGETFNFSKIDKSMHKTISNIFSILVKYSGNRKAIQNFISFQLEDLDIDYKSKERTKNYLLK